MTVKELIQQLEKVEDKEVKVYLRKEKYPGYFDVNGVEIIRRDPTENERAIMLW